LCFVKTCSHNELKKVWKLTYKKYLEQGFCRKNVEERLKLYPNLDGIEETTVLVTEDCGEIKGTISITEDGPFLLTTDISFSHSTELIRLGCKATNKKLGCVWRFISSNGCNTLIEAGLEEIKNRGIDIVLCVINPKHFGFYNRCLGFLDVERAERDPIVNNNASLLIYSSYETMVSKWYSRKCFSNFKESLL